MLNGDYSNLSLEELQGFIDEKIQKMGSESLIRVKIGWDLYLYMSPEDATLLFKIIKNSVCVKTSYNAPSEVGSFSNTSKNGEIFVIHFADGEELKKHQISQLLQVPPQELELEGGKLIEVPRDEINF